MNSTHSLNLQLLSSPSVPETIIRFHALFFTVVIIQVGIAEDIHGVLQTVVVMEELQAASNRKDNLGALAHVQGMNSSWILNDVVSRPRNPVIPEDSR